MVLADYQIQVGVSSLTSVADSLESQVGNVNDGSTANLPQQIANFAIMTYLATEGVVAESYSKPPGGESVSQVSPSDTRYRLRSRRVKYPILYVTTDREADEEPSAKLRASLADHFMLPGLDLEESGVFRYSLQEVPRGFNLMEIGSGQGIYPAGVNYTSTRPENSVR